MLLAVEGSGICSRDAKASRQTFATTWDGSGRGVGLTQAGLLDWRAGAPGSSRPMGPGASCRPWGRAWDGTVGGRQAFRRQVRICRVLSARHTG